MKMSLPNDVIMIRRDHTVGTSVLEKLQTLVIAHEAAAGHGDQDPAPSSSRQRGPTSTPSVQPSNNEGIHLKTIQISTDATQITRITGELGDK
jgi:hypothetical protein